MNIPIELTNPQLDIINCNTRGNIFIGSIGCGKTELLCHVAIREALRSRHTMIVSHTYTNLRDVILKKLIDLLEKFGITYKLNITHMIVTVNNTDILLRSSSEPERLRSYNLDSFIMDEAFLSDRNTFDILLGRLRRSDNWFWLMVTTTRGKNYIYDIIKKEGLEHIFLEENKYVSNNNLTVVRATIDDNDFLPKSYIDNLKSQYSSSFAKQELYGLIIDGEGALINNNWFKYSIPLLDRQVRFWDFAVSVKDSADYSVGGLLGKNNINKYSINNIKRVKLQWPELRRLIIDTALSDGKDVIIGLERAGQQSALIDDLSRCQELQGYIIRTVSPTKDLITRSLPWISQAELGNISIVKDTWNREMFDEFSQFSYENYNKKHDDIISSITGAHELLNTSNTATFMSQNQLFKRW